MRVKLLFLLFPLFLNANPTAYEETVSFDNDLANNFSGSSVYSVINGQGSNNYLMPPNMAGWHQNLLTYNVSAFPLVGNSMVFAIDFYYDPSAFNPNSSEKPVGIITYGNYNGITTYIDNSRIRVGSRSSVSMNSTLTLSEGWYKLMLTIDFIGGTWNDELSIKSELFSIDQGSNPILIDSLTKTDYMPSYVSDNTIDVQIHGSQMGGATKLDNFYFNSLTNDPINVSDMDGDGVNDDDDEFPFDPLETSDTDSDGIGDNSDEFPSIHTQDIISIIKNNPNRYGLFTLEGIQDIRPSSTMIEVSGNQATVQLQMEESSDLESWTETGDTATMVVPADTDTKFFRFKMTE